jgi:Protein of unknown function (DUF3592)
MYSKAMILIPAASITLGTALLLVARGRRASWSSCEATILSVESRDSDWDTVHVRFAASGTAITTAVSAPSELKLREQCGQPTSVRYNPASPSDARLESSPGKPRLIGLFFFGAGVIWLGFGLLA